MPITNTQPINKPASAEKVFDSLWIKRLSIASPSPDRIAFADIDVCPYCTEDQSILSENTRRISIRDIFSQAESNPKITAAMQAIIEAVDSIVQEQGQ